MNYYTIIEGPHTSHNENIIRQNQNSMCYYFRIENQFQIKKPNGFESKLDGIDNKLNEFKHQMRNPNCEQSNHNCMKLIEFLFQQEIEHLIEFKILIIHAKEFIVPLDGFELFDWMKKKNSKEFENYKKSIKKLLGNMRYDDDSNIFNQLCHQTSLFIKNNFIRL